MKTIANKLKPIVKTLLLIVAIILGIVGAVILMFIFVPLSSRAEPRNVQAVNTRFGLMFPAHSQVIDHELFHPMGEFGYYAIVRIRSQDACSFLTVTGAIIPSPSDEAHEKKLILQDWQNTGEFWASWTISHAHHYKVIADRTTEIFVDLDDPKFATVYVYEFGI